MTKISVALIALLSSVAVAQAGQTNYLPRQAAGAVQVASSSNVDEPCPQDREVLACVVPLGPKNGDRWSYMLVDQNGAPNSEVRYKAKVPGAGCAGMAYPASNVAIVGGVGDWFPGQLRYACRE